MLVLTVQNDGTGDLETGNYICKAYINKTLLGIARLEKFERKLGYISCLQEAVEKIREKEDIELYEIMCRVSKKGVE
jgi:hypothetical protein